MKNRSVYLIVFLSLCTCYCNKGGDTGSPAPPIPGALNFNSLKVNGASSALTYYNSNTLPVLKFSFSTPVNRSSANGSFSFTDKSGASVAFATSFENNDSTVIIQPATSLSFITKYLVTVSTALKSQNNAALSTPVNISFTTKIDSTPKFPIISDNALLDMVQKQTFKYFWDMGHPVSGLARERNTSGETVTSGGSGFGIMAIVTAISRNFITRAEGLARMQKITGFLKNNAQRFHGAFPHWLNGTTGAVIPFSTKDNGADLVETAYLMEGLLTARQYFNGADAAETALRGDINSLWNAVEWSWFRQNNQNVLYWHWSPTYNWDINLPIHGWNEALVIYVLAASSTTYPVPKAVYDNGWAGNGSIRNNNVYYGYQLPLGPSRGGPLFFEHYSFLGINPMGLTDAYADYTLQVKNHTFINYNYCKANPGNYFGYSDSCWGLTASDDINGYLAHEPGNDDGVISPTAALSSFAYTPTESMQALKFFYYVLGDKIWKDYGFVDAFSLHDTWFANSFLAIDQGPIIVMIENYRSKLLWNLFTSCPEVNAGMKALGFQAPYL